MEVNPLLSTPAHACPCTEVTPQNTTSLANSDDRYVTISKDTDCYGTAELRQMGEHADLGQLP